MDFSATLQRIVQGLDSLDTQRNAWSQLCNVADSLTAQTAPLFVKGLRRYAELLQRPSARNLLCRAYTVATSSSPRLFSRAKTVLAMVEGLLSQCIDAESTVREACAEALAQVFHHVVPLVGGDAGASPSRRRASANGSAQKRKGGVVQRRQDPTDSSNAFATFVVTKLAALLQVPDASSQLGAALCLGSICGCDANPRLGRTSARTTADRGLAVSMSPAGRDLVEENLGLLQTKLNQALWNTKSVAGALVCDVWSSLLINFDDRLRDWRVRGRLMECLLRLLNLPAEDTHWRVKVASLRTLELCCNSPHVKTISSAESSALQSALERQARSQVGDVRKAARLCRQSLSSLLMPARPQTRQRESLPKPWKKTFVAKQRPMPFETESVDPLLDASIQEDTSAVDDLISVGTETNYDMSFVADEPHSGSPTTVALELELSDGQQSALLMRYSRALRACGTAVFGSLVMNSRNVEFMPPWPNGLERTAALMRETGPVLPVLGPRQRVAVLRCCCFMLADVYGARPSSVDLANAAVALAWVEQAVHMELCYSQPLLQKLLAQLYRLSGEPLPCATVAAELLHKLRQIA